MAENLSHQSPDGNPETTENDLSLLTQEANQLQKEVQQGPNERIKKVNQKLIDRKMNPAAEKIKEVIESVGSADKERREIRDQGGFKFNLIEDTDNMIMFSSYGKQVKIQILREDEYDINIISKFNIVLPDGSLFDIGRLKSSVLQEKNINEYTKERELYSALIFMSNTINNLEFTVKGRCDKDHKYLENLKKMVNPKLGIKRAKFGKIARYPRHYLCIIGNVDGKEVFLPITGGIPSDPSNRDDFSALLTNYIQDVRDAVLDTQN